MDNAYLKKICRHEVVADFYKGRSEHPFMRLCQDEVDKKTLKFSFIE